MCNSAVELFIADNSEVNWKGRKCLVDSTDYTKEKKVTPSSTQQRIEHYSANPRDDLIELAQSWVRIMAIRYPSCFSKEEKRCQKTTGGIALPICRYASASLPKNLYESGNDWMRAASFGVKRLYFSLT